MNIEKFCNIYNLGNIISINKIPGGLMHKMFKVETDKGVYCIKVLNPEVMSRKTAHNNFIISETISNFAKKNGIPASCALKIDDNYLTKLDNIYYMIFDYLEGKTLNDNEITVNHCKKIGNILAHIHNLDYKEIGLKPNIVEYKKIYDWDSYINNPNFNKMSYKNLYLSNYKKYNSLLKRANQRFNDSNNSQTICHSDMDPKNVMWHNDNPIIIDWESASISNPCIELLEDALCWSGFLSNNFNKDKFSTIFKEYFKYRTINNIDWYDVICGNLVGRLGWLKYNLDRSLGIISKDIEEIKIAENEVIKTIDEINRYLDLIGDMDDIIIKLTTKEENYDDIIKQIIDTNDILKGKQFKLINSGFTNTIYSSDNHIIRICTDSKNEDRFINEINFYKTNNNKGIPKLYYSDTTKNIVPFYYEIIEKVPGKPLYEVWRLLTKQEKEEVITQMINILKPLHSKQVSSYNFQNQLKEKVLALKESCNLDNNLSNDLIKICNKYFNNNTFGLIHGDLHFDNLIYNAKFLYLIDFERTLIAPIDYEFRILNTCKYVPWLWASSKTDMLTIESDYQELIDIILSNYQELNNIPNIKERLDFYTILELLNNYKNTKDIDRLNEVKELVKTIKKKK
ncbi:MAG: phosphotransferase [Bacilli bacterium]|nr:phosphotransferase [Bacilli bacterium]